MKLTIREHLKQSKVSSEKDVLAFRGIPHNIIRKCNIVLIDGDVLKSRWHGVRPSRFSSEFLDTELEFDIKYIKDLPKWDQFYKIEEFHCKNINIITK